MVHLSQEYYVAIKKNEETICWKDLQDILLNEKQMHNNSLCIVKRRGHYML